MTDVTQILNAIDQGDSSAAGQLLPLVYEELRKLAAAKLAQEKPGQTLQATALVHEAYVRLVDVEKAQRWDSRGHFFAAAAEAMRRILVDNARRKQTRRHGGEFVRHTLEDLPEVVPQLGDDLLALNEALEKLSREDPVKAELVKLRHFAGLTVDQAAEALNVSPATADRYWSYARAWLHAEITRNLPPGAADKKTENP
ncbi:MAG: sigma-70 family RNA polymerase sigma factor [Pirellulales bacterium]|nr:sigma-70 family RNA polymerase sigma factor [Pirellulales bacterium]